MADLELNKRLKEVFEQSGLLQRDFADKIGVSIATVNELLNNKKGAGMVVVQGLLNGFPDVSEEWFVTGRGEPKKNKYGYGKNSGNMVTIPYYPDINASAGLDFLTDNGHAYSIPISIPYTDAQAFINVFGDSMDPKYRSGEIIGIKEVPKEYVMYGHAYVVQMGNGDAYLKYIRKGKDAHHWQLASENPQYEPREFNLSKIQKIFIIKAVISKTEML
jgi:phage repressor protein C with HTH and peptisase S24 domain